MKPTTLPNPARLREIPKQFSWVDHRLVRDGYFESCSCEALALYLFLLTVADEQGISYYGQTRLMKQLKLDVARLMMAREQLITKGLISYAKPYYQVLSLSACKSVSTTVVRQNKSVKINQLLAQFAGGQHD